ncbi:MAG: histidine kinase [Treponema sp.]|jgi:sensor histidine kinase YesM|nr:histidine kinase [Treponema sp.]
MNFSNPLRRRKKYSVASKQIEFFLLFIALPVLAILTLFAFFFRYRIVEITKNQREVILQQYASGIDVELQSMSIIASSLIHNTALMNRTGALMNAKTAEQRYFISSEIEKVFQTYFILLRQLAGFYLILENENNPFVSRNYAGIILSNEEIEACIAMADANRGVISIPDVLNFSYGQQSGWYIASLAVSPSQGSNTGIRSLIVSFVINPLQDFVRWNNSRELSSRTSSDYFLYGRNGKILASGDTSLIGAEIAGIIARYGKSRIIIEAPVESPGWTLVEAINIRSLTKPLDTILYILYFAMLVIVLFFVRYNTFFFARILNPLKLMIAKMESVGNGDFSVRAESGNFIELNKISESFNYMVEKISILTEAIKEEHRERTKTEIEALRYQLNPHFLCNALNAIRMMAIITKNDAIKKMSAALMTITEDTLAGEDMVYSLEHELHILDSYVYIMQVRYGNTFELIKDVDSSLLNLGVPSMILQPLVENAILHGFAGLSGPGAIVVSAAMHENALIISVRDNGCGMDIQTQTDVFNNSRAGHKGLSRIGLYNVRRRIMLSYGSGYGVEMASFPGDGTVVTLKLPVQQTVRHESRISDRNPL